MPLTLTQREQILEARIALYKENGYTLKSHTQTDAVMVKANRGKKASADGCLTFITLGAWLIPAALGAASGDYSKVKIHVNTDGTVDLS